MAYQQRPHIRRLNPWLSARVLQDAHGGKVLVTLALRTSPRSRTLGTFGELVCASALRVVCSRVALDARHDFSNLGKSRIDGKIEG
jgi:hypothetical protein